jgi:hypothetical protein
MDDEIQLHRKLAVDLFNYVWELLDKSERTIEENDTMLHAAHASRYHWEKAGTVINLARGEWQVSRVYSVLRRSEPALYHARRCLEICQQNGIGDFDLAFAYEALARASLVAGNIPDCTHYRTLAEQAGHSIAEQDDKDYFFKDLNTIPSM